MPKKQPSQQKNQEIEDFITSEKTAEDLNNICEKYGVLDEKKIEEIAYQVGLVILGKLTPEELSGSLKKNAGIENKVAEEISSEIKRTILSQTKGDLVKEASQPAKPKKEGPKRPRRKDAYRELIE